MADDNQEETKPDMGYGKPPKDKQFKKGKSGNPRGRPKGRRNNKTLIEHGMNKRVWVVENGKRKRVPKRQVIITTLINKAATGHNPSIAQLNALESAGIADGSCEGEELKNAPLSQDHKQILQELLDRYFPSRTAGTGGDDEPN